MKLPVHVSSVYNFQPSIQYGVIYECLVMILLGKCLGVPPGRNRMTIVMTGFNIDNLSCIHCLIKHVIVNETTTTYF
jgi:hypothetical protein